jgi:hypothetical protein
MLNQKFNDELGVLQQFYQVNKKLNNEKIASHIDSFTSVQRTI